MKNRSGFTLIEVLIVMSIIAIVGVAMTQSLISQISKGRDGRRKSDLGRLKVAFEDYFSDYEHYPPASIVNDCGSFDLRPYIPAIPCDPKTKQPYLYDGRDSSGSVELTEPTQYRILTALENTSDSGILDAGCSPTTGCGGDGVANEYVFGIAMGMTVHQ